MVNNRLLLIDHSLVGFVKWLAETLGLNRFAFCGFQRTVLRYHEAEIESIDDFLIWLLY